MGNISGGDRNQLRRIGANSLLTCLGVMGGEVAVARRKGAMVEQISVLFSPGK
jgi:hypothetical protein